VPVGVPIVLHSALQGTKYNRACRHQQTLSINQCAASHRKASSLCNDSKMWLPADGTWVWSEAGVFGQEIRKGLQIGMDSAGMGFLHEWVGEFAKNSSDAALDLEEVGEAGSASLRFQDVAD
jgi:hypothetical protein